MQWSQRTDEHEIPKKWFVSYVDILFSIEFQVARISCSCFKLTNKWIFCRGAIKSFKIYSNAVIRESNQCRLIPTAQRSREKHRYFQKLLPRYRDKFSIFNKLLFSLALYILSCKSYYSKRMWFIHFIATKWQTSCGRKRERLRDDTFSTSIKHAVQSVRVIDSMHEVRK